MICGLSSRPACSGYSTKTSSSRFTHPWISTKTLRLSRRKARAYHMVNFSNNIDDWGKYTLKDETQRKMRRDHRVYIKYIVNQDLITNSKLFTPMSKARDKKPRVFQHCSTKMVSYTVVARVKMRSSISNLKMSTLKKIPDPGQSNIPSMESIIVITPGAIKLLLISSLTRPLGPDNIPNRLLIIVAEEIPQCSQAYFKLPWKWSQFLLIGERL